MAQTSHLSLASLNLFSGQFPELDRLVPPVHLPQLAVLTFPAARHGLGPHPAPVLLLHGALAAVSAGVVALVGLLEGARPVSYPGHRYGGYLQLELRHELRISLLS